MVELEWLDNSLILGIIVEIPEYGVLKTQIEFVFHLVMEGLFRKYDSVVEHVEEVPLVDEVAFFETNKI